MSSFEALLSPDASSVTVRLPNGPLGAAEIDDIMHQLAELRSRLQPPPRLARPLADILPIVDPRYWVQADAAVGGVLLQIEHPLGWLNFMQPPAEAIKLGELLRAEALTLPGAQRSQT